MKFKEEKAVDSLDLYLTRPSFLSMVEQMAYIKNTKILPELPRKSFPAVHADARI